MTKPWHDTELCECGGPITPVQSDSPDLVRDVHHVFCCACGEDWHEDDVQKLVRIWWSYGAYEGCMAAGGTP